MCLKYSIMIIKDLVLHYKEREGYIVIERGRALQVVLISMPMLE